MSDTTTHGTNYGKPWTTIGMFPDFESADLARKAAPTGFDAKIHRQREFFAVKIRAANVQAPVQEEKVAASEPQATKKPRAKTDTKGRK